MKPTLYLLSFCFLLLLSCKKGNESTNLRCMNFITYTPSNFDAQDSATIFIPTAFTPNGVGEVINDRFYAIADGLSDFSITIYSNGQAVYQSNDLADGWDGTVNGQIQYGLYPYEINAKNHFNKEIQIFGYVTSFSNEMKIDDCQECRFADQVVPRKGFVTPTNEINFCP